MSVNCNSINLYESLKYCEGATTMPGIRRHAFYIPKSDIVAFPTLPELSAEDISMGELATYNGNFVLAADKTFKSIDLDDSASNVTSESQGEKYGKTFLNKATFKHPGKGKEATGFARLANNSDLLFLYQERDGAIRVLGNEAFSTNIKPNQESGAKETDAAGTTFNIEVSDRCPAPFYEGIIPTEEGNIDASTGSVVVDNGE